MSDVSRRTFLRAATLTLATVALPLAAAEGALAAPRAGTTGPGAPAGAVLARASFAPHLHRAFRMVGPARGDKAGATSGRGTVRAVPAEVADVRGAAPGDDHCFSLLFSVPRKSRATQGVYRFERAAFGRATLFAVPVDRGLDARFYQVVVNRPV